MTPADVLVALAEAGVVLWVDAGGLRFRAPEGALSASLRDRARACRPALVALVRSGAALPVETRAWPEAWRDGFEERTGMMEFEGGASRADAEREAERLVRVEHAVGFVRRTKFVVTPDAAVATARPGSGPCR